MIFLSFKETLGDIGSKIFPSFEAFIVQLLATAVLFFVVIKFLYKPAKEFIAKRQKYIKNQIDEADTKLNKADTILKEAEETKNKNLKETSKLLKESKEEASKQKELIIESAKQEANDIKKNALKEIEVEKNKARNEIKKEVVGLSIDISKNILRRDLTEEDENNSFEELVKEVEKDE